MWNPLAYETSKWWGLGLLKLYFLSKGIQSQLNIKASKLEHMPKERKSNLTTTPLWPRLHHPAHLQVHEDVRLLPTSEFES